MIKTKPHFDVAFFMFANKYLNLLCQAKFIFIDSAMVSFFSFLRDQLGEILYQLHRILIRKPIYSSHQ